MLHTEPLELRFMVPQSGYGFGAFHLGDIAQTRLFFEMANTALFRAANGQPAPDTPNKM